MRLKSSESLSSFRLNSINCSVLLIAMSPLYSRHAVFQAFCAPFPRFSSFLQCTAIVALALKTAPLLLLLAFFGLSPENRRTERGLEGPFEQGASLLYPAILPAHIRKPHAFYFRQFRTFRPKCTKCTISVIYGVQYCTLSVLFTFYTTVYILAFSTVIGTGSYHFRAIWA